METRNTNATLEMKVRVKRFVNLRDAETEEIETRILTLKVSDEFAQAFRKEFQRQRNEDIERSEVISEKHQLFIRGYFDLYDEQGGVGYSV